MCSANRRLLICVTILLFCLTACKAKAETELEIVYAREPCQIESGGTMEFTLKGELPDDAEINWEVARGEITENMRTIVVYTAPEVEKDTTVFINVTITTGKKKVPIAISCDILGNTVAQKTIDTAGITPTSINAPTATLVPPSPTEAPPSPTTSPATSTPVAVQNLVKNYGFEEEFQTSWASEGQVEIQQSTDSYAGQYALCFTQKSTTAKQWAIIGQIVKVEENTYYQFTAKIFTVDVTEFHLRVDWLNNGNLIKQEQVGSAFNGKTDEWITVGGTTVLAPESATHADLRLIHGLQNEEQPIVGSMVCVDDVIFATSFANAPQDSPSDQDIIDEKSSLLSFANGLSDEQLCSYDLGAISLVVPTKTEVGIIRTYDLSLARDYPFGYIIGNGYSAYYVDKAGQMEILGQTGVTFSIDIADPAQRGQLQLKDGIFYVIHPDIAEEFLQLRTRQLRVCEEKDRAVKHYP